jgi:hypothetical protein
LIFHDLDPFLRRKAVQSDILDHSMDAKPPAGLAAQGLVLPFVMVNRYSKPGPLHHEGTLRLEVGKQFSSADRGADHVCTVGKKGLPLQRLVPVHDLAG